MSGKVIDAISIFSANITVAIEELEKGNTAEVLSTLRGIMIAMPPPTDEYLTFARENMEELKRERGH